VKLSRIKASVTAAAMAAACLSAVAPARAAGSPIIGAGDPNAIAGHYIVVLKGIAGPQVASEAAALTAHYGGTSGHVYTTALQGFVLSGTDAQATQMTSDPAVSYVEQDLKVQAAGTQVLPPATAGCRTVKSACACSFRHVPWATTCTRSSRSWVSRRGGS
jgi:hypothetical protein